VRVEDDRREDDAVPRGSAASRARAEQGGWAGEASAATPPRHEANPQPNRQRQSLRLATSFVVASCDDASMITLSTSGYLISRTGIDAAPHRENTTERSVG